MPVMPDTRIALSGLSSGGDRPSFSPIQTLGALMQIKEQQMAYEGRRLENEKRQRELEDDDAVSNALMQHERPEDAIEYLWKNGKSDAASRLSKDVLGERTARWQESDAQLKLNGTRLEQASQLLASVKGKGNAPYQTVRPQVAKLVEPIYGQAINDYLPTEYNESQIDALIQAGTSRRDQIQQQRDLTNNWMELYSRGALSFSDLAKKFPELVGPDGKPNPNAAQWAKPAMDAQQDMQELLMRQLLTAQSPDEYHQILATAHDNGMPSGVLQSAPAWIDDPRERHQKLTMLGMTLPQRATAEAAARNADRMTDAEERRQDRFEAAERRRNEAAAGRGTLTPNQRYSEEDSQEKEIAETEKQLRENPDKPVDAGYVQLAQARKAAASLPASDTSDAAAGTRSLATIANDYIKKRVSTENKKRERIQHLPPIEESAKTAKANKDRATYDKLEKVYAGITNGVGALSDIVPWPDKNAGVLTPEVTAQRRKDYDAIIAQLKDPKLSPEQRRSLQAQAEQLAGALR
jgi:hypothetical protein